MAEHQGSGQTDPTQAAAVDDAARALLSAWDAAREQATPRLSAPQLGALLAVERAEGINLRGLAGQLNMILSSASRLCDRLVAAGLVERAPGQADRREIALFLTPSSRALLEKLRTTRRSMLAAVLERMSPGGRAALLRGLSEFAAVSRTDSGESARTA
ncbi:MarR family winged helix-turn-helix transcriptional regulator [Mangrovihabitans endophyticus]|uniref:MarR family transcriptional regulator n=1 Tax=Mangrovihabitans endophyticus TaxID=1751298 RepID=A0A8J3C2X4_9ACTN|nr:MarR family transcriptional regulator [Mangrovihabitans endophyticus]GGL02352.1 MarR family transcriptional regulator [Mangrovihabitans endophyticus]